MINPAEEPDVPPAPDDAPPLRDPTDDADGNPDRMDADAPSLPQRRRRTP